MRTFTPGALAALLVVYFTVTVAAQTPDSTNAEAPKSPMFECKERQKDIAQPPNRNPSAPADRSGKQTPIETSKDISAQSPCPVGQVPVPIERFAPKGHPDHSATAFDTPYYYAYANASAGGKIPLFDGGGVVTKVENPAVASDSGVHSLFEISVQGGTGNGQIVEVGWIVNRGDSTPHLFVYHWIDWNQTCYNGCGWVQWNPSIYPGMALQPGSSTYMGWVIVDGNWWGWYADQWIGYFPGSIWKGAYTKSTLVQWFGEVDEEDPTPATDMGNGQRANVDWAARFWYPCAVDAAAWVCWINPNPTIYQPNAPWYTILNIGGSALRYGGPGGRAGAGVNP
jgi:hypothetical protein